MENILTSAPARRLNEANSQLRDLIRAGYPKLGTLRDLLARYVDLWSSIFGSIAVGPTEGDRQMPAPAVEAIHAVLDENARRLDFVGRIATGTDYDTMADMLKMARAELREAAAVVSREDPHSFFGGGIETFETHASRVWPQVRAEIEQDRQARAAAAEMNELRDETRALADQVRQSAGVVSQGKNSEAFEEHAQAEARSAHGFRIATYTLFALTVIVLVAPSLVALQTGLALFGEDPIIATATRIAIGAVIAGAATYMARQAGHHRRVHVWAKSIATQLRSLDAFVAPITDETVRNGVYEAMGRRMLSEPPHNSKGGDAQTDSTNLIQLATELVRRPHP